MSVVNRRCRCDADDPSCQHRREPPDDPADTYEPPDEPTALDAIDDAAFEAALAERAGTAAARARLEHDVWALVTQVARQAEPPGAEARRLLCERARIDRYEDAACGQQARAA